MSAFFEALVFVPLALVLWLANLADYRREQSGRGSRLAIVVYLCLGMLYLLLAISSLLLIAALTIGSAPDSTIPIRQGIASPGLLVAAFIIPAVFGGALLVPKVRRFAGRFIAIDPYRTVHAVALSFVALTPSLLLLNLGVGLENLAGSLTSRRGPDAGQSLIASIWTQEIALLILASIGVGLLSRRSPRSVLSRLSIVLADNKTVLVAMFLGAVVSICAELVVQGAVSLGYSMDAGVSRLNEALYGPWVKTTAGILTIAIAAPLGEEALFRGALQPRFGLVLTSLLFALMHSNYGITLLTVVVFGVGLFLGIVRQRSNTTASMIAHAAYNATQALMGLV
jgi:hypothetical protein